MLGLLRGTIAVQMCYEVGEMVYEDLLTTNQEGMKVMGLRNAFAIDRFFGQYVPSDNRNLVEMIGQNAPGKKFSDTRSNHNSMVSNRLRVMAHVVSPNLANHKKCNQIGVLGNIYVSLVSTCSIQKLRI